MVVKTSYGCIDHWRRIETIERRAAWFVDACGLIFEERLIGRDFASLRGKVPAAESLQGLPAHPTELVVVPHVDEGPTGARVLKIGITEICAVSRAIVVHCGRNVEVADLFAVRVADDVADATVVHALRSVFWIPHNFIDEVAEVQHEANTICFGSALILENHSAVGVLRAVVGILATHESKADGSGVVHGGCCDGAADATAEAFGVAEAVPIHMAGFQTPHQHAAGPVRCRRHWRRGCCDNA